jgi:hypothetical protein
MRSHASPAWRQRSQPSGEGVQLIVDEHPQSTAARRPIQAPVIFHYVVKRQFGNGHNLIADQRRRRYSPDQHATRARRATLAQMVMSWRP